LILTKGFFGAGGIGHGFLLALKSLDGNVQRGFGDSSQTIRNRKSNFRPTDFPASLKENDLHIRTKLKEK
jgi:hypothetical protein